MANPAYFFNWQAEVENRSTQKEREIQSRNQTYIFLGILGSLYGSFVVTNGAGGLLALVLAGPPRFADIVAGCALSSPTGCGSAVQNLTTAYDVYPTVMWPKAVDWGLLTAHSTSQHVYGMLTHPCRLLTRW